MTTLPAQILEASLLPPNATGAERAIEASLRLDIDLSVVGTLWDADTCPPDILPFLAWGLAVPYWDPDWTDAEKRKAVRDAIPQHRTKGTRGLVEQVLDRFHPLLTLVEWWEMRPKGPPNTFEVRAPAPDIPASFLTAETTNAIIRDVAAAKRLSQHFTFVQNLEAQAGLYLTPGAMTASFNRSEMAAIHDTDPRWQTYLLTEDGEPLQTEDGQFLEV